MYIYKGLLSFWSRKPTLWNHPLTVDHTPRLFKGLAKTSFLPSAAMFSLNKPPGLYIRQHPARGPKISKPAQPLAKMGRGSTRLKQDPVRNVCKYGLCSFAQRINFFNYSSSHAQLWHMCVRGILFPKLHLFLAIKVIRQKMVCLELCKQPF